MGNALGILALYTSTDRGAVQNLADILEFLDFAAGDDHSERRAKASPVLNGRALSPNFLRTNQKWMLQSI